MDNNLKDFTTAIPKQEGDVKVIAYRTNAAGKEFEYKALLQYFGGSSYGLGWSGEPPYNLSNEEYWNLRWGKTIKWYYGTMRCKIVEESELDSSHDMHIRTLGLV